MFLIFTFLFGSTSGFWLTPAAFCAAFAQLAFNTLVYIFYTYYSRPGAKL